MIPVHRSGTLLALVAVIALVAACSGGTGGLGSVPTSEPTASAEPTSPDLTPGPSGSISAVDRAVDRTVGLARRHDRPVGIAVRRPTR